MRCDGERVKQLRKSAGYSQQDVADKAKLSKSTVERAERGSPIDFQSIHQIAAVLGVTFDELVHPDSRGDAGMKANLVPVKPLASASELMEMVLRCATVRFEIGNYPPAEQLGKVAAVVRDIERYLPGNFNTSWDLLEKWRSGAGDRLEGLVIIQKAIDVLGSAQLHMLVGEYVAEMSPSEAHAAVEEYVMMTMESLGMTSGTVDTCKRVGLLLIVNTTERHRSIKVDDQAPDDPNLRGASVEISNI